MKSKAKILHSHCQNYYLYFSKYLNISVKPFRGFQMFSVQGILQDKSQSKYSCIHICAKTEAHFDSLWKFYFSPCSLVKQVYTLISVFPSVQLWFCDTWGSFVLSLRTLDQFSMNLYIWIKVRALFVLWNWKFKRRCC